MPVEQVTYNGPDGATMGASSTETISFYGATVVSRYVGVGAASTYRTSTSSASGFASDVELTSFIRQVSTITVALRNLGLID